MATTQEKWQEIANRGLQDRFDPETRAKFDEAVKRGLIQVQAQPAQQQAATGQQDLATTEPQEIPAFPDEPGKTMASELPELSGILAGEDIGKVAALTPLLAVTTDNNEFADIVTNIFPNLGKQFSPAGEIILTNNKTGAKALVNKVGFSPVDAIQAIGLIGSFTPAGRAATLGGAGLKTGAKGLAQRAAQGAAASGVTQAGIEGIQQQVGGEFDAGEVGLAAGFGGAGEVVAPLLPSLASRFKRFLGATPEGEAAQVIQTGAETGTRVLTSDVIQPKTFIGRSFQQLGEKIGVLGTGGIRAEQQIARQDIVQSIADDFGIQNVNDDFLPSIIDSMTKKQAKGLENAALVRNKVVDKLTPLGDVPTTNTINAIDRAIAKQRTLKGKADQGLINDLETTRQSITGNFEHVKNIRSDVIADLKAVRRGEDTRSIPALQSVKSAIDKDMVIFARKSQKELSDKTLVKDWLSSNREFAFELGKGKDAVLKRLLDSGEAKPSSISPILRSGDPTQMKKLRNSLTEKGRKSASAAIVKDALETSKFFTTANPDLFINAINKPKFQKAIEVFFTQEQKDSLKGLTKLLESTRRAQSAPVAVASAQQTVPIGVLAGSIAEPFTAFLTGGTLAAVTRGYESKFVRDSLLKLAASKKGSAAEAALLKELKPIISSATQTARQTENKEGNQ